jgi:hypothetical protein
MFESIEVAGLGAIPFPLVEKRARVNGMAKESAQEDGAGVPNMMKRVFLTVRLRVNVAWRTPIAVTRPA